MGKLAKNWVNNTYKNDNKRQKQLQNLMFFIFFFFWGGLMCAAIIFSSVKGSSFVPLLVFLCWHSYSCFSMFVFYSHVLFYLFNQYCWISSLSTLRFFLNPSTYNALLKHIWQGFRYSYQSCPTVSSQIWACDIILKWNVLDIKFIPTSLAF